MNKESKKETMLVTSLASK